MAVVDKLTGLTKRLHQAQMLMESVERGQGVLMASYAQKLQPLYFECVGCGPEYRVFHHAEYLRLLVHLHFEEIFDGGGSTEGLYEECKVEAWQAGLILNPVTGEESPHK